MTTLRTPWGTAADGTPIELVELASDRARVSIITWGAIVQALHCPDRAGLMGDIVLGFDDLAGYTNPTQPFLGATVGRFANRIANGRFTVQGKEHQLPRNDGPHTLHGGAQGFWARPWTITEVAQTPEGAYVEMTLTSDDGDMGFPGRLDVTTRYELAGNVLSQEVTASTDAPTVVNFTNHTYFNLHGVPTSPVADHLLAVPASHYVPVDDSAIPLPGPPVDVTGTGFDLRQPTLIEGWLDHTWVLDASEGGGDRRTAAVLSDPCTGRRVTVRTTEPGVQCYSGKFLDGTLRGKGGVSLPRGGGVCLETQHFPDSPNRPDYPSTELAPGELFRTVTEWQLDAG